MRSILDVWSSGDLWDILAEPPSGNLDTQDMRTGNLWARDITTAVTCEQTVTKAGEGA